MGVKKIGHMALHYKLFIAFALITRSDEGSPTLGEELTKH